MPVRAAFHWTEDEYRRVVQHHFRKMIRPSIRYFVGGAFLFLFLLCGYAVIRSFSLPDSQEGRGTVIVMTLSFLYGALGMIFEERISLFFGIRRFRARQDANALVRWEFDNQRLHQATDTGLRADFPWNTVRQITEVSDGFLIYVPKRFYWLPLSAFEQANGPQQFRELAGQNNVRFQRR